MSRRFVVLCEGFGDRDFWTGWLEYLGAANLFDLTGADRVRLEARIAPHRLERGEHVFEAPGGDRIFVRPCYNAKALWRALDLLSKDLDPPATIVVNVDSDRMAAEGDPEAGARENLSRLIQLATGKRPVGELPWNLHRTRVELLVWHCRDGAGTVGVPDKQTLERLVCAAAAESSASDAHPAGWAVSVRDFLAQEPRGGNGHKNHALAYCAKFFVPEREDFFRAAWSRDSFPRVAAALEARLRATGGWRVAESLVDFVEDSL